MKNALIYHGGGSFKSGYSSRGGGSVLDEKVKVTATDTTPDYLYPNKITSGPSNKGDIIIRELLGAGAYEQLAIYSKREITLIFVNAEGDFQTNDSIPIPESLKNDWSGYFIPFQGITFHEVFGLIHKYKTSVLSQVNIRFRYYSTPSAVIASPAIGTILGDDLLFSLDNSLNLFKYYSGSAKNNLGWNCPGNNMLIPYCQASNALRVDGINIVMRGTINEYSPS